jgi:hypothetical protein
MIIYAGANSWPELTERRALLVCSLVFAALLLAAQGANAQATYTLKVTTDSPSYAASQTVKITGSVTPAPGPSTAVTLKVINPSGMVLVVGAAEVGATTGMYNFTLVAGGSSGWIAGTYTVNATWGAYPPQIYAQTRFTYSPAAVTTTTSTTTTTTSTTGTTTTTSTTVGETSSTLTTSSSSSKAASGGIPVFPFNGALTVLLAVLVASGYLVARRVAFGRSPPLR